MHTSAPRGAAAVSTKFPRTYLQVNALSPCFVCADRGQRAVFRSQMTFILGCRVGVSGEQVFRGSESTCTLEVWDQDGHCQQSQTKGKEL